jgi:large subunit ribosomal protein L3
MSGMTSSQLRKQAVCGVTLVIRREWRTEHLSSLPSILTIECRIGKGFQGVMKRHGFRGQPASHGATKVHRAPGSIGQNTVRLLCRVPQSLLITDFSVSSCSVSLGAIITWTTVLPPTPLMPKLSVIVHPQTPARVFPNKKMPGHMGHTQVTTHNLLVHRIDTALNLLFVRGAVPGPDDAYISVKDAIRGVKWRANLAFLKGKEDTEWLGEGVKGLPMPTVTAERVKAEGWPEVVEWPGEGKA